MGKIGEKFNTSFQAWERVRITLDILRELDMQKQQAFERQAQEIEKELVTI